jgi:hypothetical protein
MTRLRRIALTVVVGVLVTLPSVGSALAGITLPSTTGTGAGPFTTLIALTEDSSQQSNTGEQSEFFV